MRFSSLLFIVAVMLAGCGQQGPLVPATEPAPESMGTSAQQLWDEAATWTSA